MTDSIPSVEVALATHNSEKFLGELLESLFRQTYQAFTILLSDDGSSDTTSEIVREFERRYPDRIKRIDNPRRPASALGNFAWLIDRLSADYALFCDLDDVWLPDKIELSLECIRRAELRYGAATPIIVHTDLTIVGAELEVLHPSALRGQRIDPARNSLRLLLMANTVTGCAP